MDVSNLNLLRLEVLLEPISVEDALRRHAVVADERVRKRQQLAAIRRVRQGLGVPRLLQPKLSGRSRKSARRRPVPDFFLPGAFRGVAGWIIGTQTHT
jgi:hypothetical protein